VQLGGRFDVNAHGRTGTIAAGTDFDVFTGA
jgi:hypothetical protein